MTIVEKQFEDRLFPAVIDGPHDPMADEISAALTIVPRIDALKKIFWEILGFERRTDSLSLSLLPPRTELSLNSIEVFGQSDDFRVIIVRMDRGSVWLWMNISPILTDIFNKWEESVVLLSDVYERRWFLAYRQSDTKEITGAELFSDDKKDLELILELTDRLEELSWKTTFEIDKAIDETLDDDEKLEAVDRWKKKLRRVQSSVREKEGTIWALEEMKKEWYAYELFKPEEELRAFKLLQKLWPKPRDLMPPESMPFARSLAKECICRNLRLIAYVAGKYSHRIGATIDYEDLLQEGAFGLMKAVSLFDYRKGWKFSTYATWWVNQTISRFIADHSNLIRLPVYKYDQYVKYKRAQGLVDSHQHSLEDACNLVGMNIQNYSQCETLPVNRVEFEPLVTIKPNQDNDGVKVLVSDDENPFKRLDREATRIVVNKALEKLPPKEFEIIVMRFGLLGEREHTLEEVGELQGVTRERIRQVQNRAIGKLQKRIAVILGCEDCVDQEHIDQLLSCF